MSGRKAPADLGAGLSVTKPQIGIQHPSGQSQYGALGQAERAFSAGSTFLSGMLAISASQFLGAPLRFVDPKFYDQYMAWTKESFAVLVSTMTQLWAPTAVRVTGDDSMKEQLFQMQDGSLRCNFPHRLVLMANHQLYTDWLYLWWIAYTNKMHGRIYIILKESLKNVPIFGWSAQFYNFIFLARKWEIDKPRFKSQLQRLSNPLDPMWLLIFPEGTNLSSETREKSKAWAAKTGVPDMKHQLLPRSTGLQYCLQELAPSTNWLYDCTIAYEGVPEGQFGQDIFTLRSSLFEGRPPKSVNMYWRRWRVSELPINDTDAFSTWLRDRWTEKDFLLNHFYRTGTFPDGDVAKAMRADGALRKLASQQQQKTGKKQTYKPNTKSAKFINTEVKAGGMEEFMGIFEPIASAASAISSGQLNPENVDLEALMGKVAAQQGARALQNGKAILPDSFASNLKIDKAPNLDPRIKAVIEQANANAQMRLRQAAGTDASKLAKSSPLQQQRRQSHMTPVETLVTRPITSYAVRQGANALAQAGSARKQSQIVGQKKNVAQGKTLPLRSRSDSASTTASSGPNIAARQKTHPLAGKSISKAEWDKIQAQQKARS